MNEQVTVDPIEARARNMGWVPESEWDEERAAREGKRKPRAFKSAEEYVRDVEGSIPMLRERNQALSDELTTVKGKLGEIDTLKARLDDTGRLAEHLLESQRRASQTAYERGVADARAKMKQAAKEGDEEAHEAAQAELDRLEEERTADILPVEPPPPREPDPPIADTVDERRRKAREKLTPTTRSWVEANPWFDNDITLNGAMIYELGQVKVERPDLGEHEGLEEAKQRVVDKFPGKFGINPARNGASSVGRPGNGGQRTSGRTFADVPREDQESFRRQQKIMKEQRNVDYTEEEFLAMYDWGN